MKLLIAAQDMFIRDEDDRRYPYNDETGERVRLESGNITIGVGHNLDSSPLPNDIVMLLLNKDIALAMKDAQDVISRPIWDTLSPNRQLAIINMAFNLGAYGLLNFTNMIAAIRSYQFHIAAKEALDSVWARQVGDRAVRIADMIRLG